ncbi:hypothetical protein [Glycomyces sp. NPDC048151]|uniref:hypothetical protein n=1 Tax=Glycomyces sp. NPDC048151 TaxID=3364002 RepID=UPI00371FF151
MRSDDVTIEGLELRLTAFLGDSLVYVSRSGSEIPRAGEVNQIGLAGGVDRIDNGTIQRPRLAVFRADLIPGLLDAHDAVIAAAVAYYRQHNPKSISALRVNPEPSTSGRT